MKGRPCLLAKGLCHMNLALHSGFSLSAFLALHHASLHFTREPSTMLIALHYMYACAVVQSTPLGQCGIHDFIAPLQIEVDDWISLALRIFILG